MRSASVSRNTTCFGDVGSRAFLTIGYLWPFLDTVDSNDNHFICPLFCRGAVGSVAQIPRFDQDCASCQSPLHLHPARLYAPRTTALRRTLSPVDLPRFGGRVVESIY